MNICAVIVSYHPDKKTINNINALLLQVDQIVIVDNGSGLVAKTLFNQLEEHPKLSIIYNDENLGIASALNIGIKHAKNLGYEWIITFDQDSKLAPNSISKMLKAYEAYPEQENISSLSPRYCDIATTRIWSTCSQDSLNPASSYAETLVVISSGNMIKTCVFDEVGYFNEALFIDHVDTEFCLRCANFGYKILEVYDAILEHSIGSPTEHKFFGRTLATSNHSALRRYYSARNGIYIYRKFLFKQTNWVLKNIYFYLKSVIAMILFEQYRLQKLKAIFLGVSHGLSGKMGKFEL